ncbi:Dolichyl-diphosphooligosaccharide--protein glycosyltransferase subunit 2 [Striga hermonthica]|uniref:Nucleolar protein 10 n=1 Tax=Striga hermonthica TaxID=68872 RepID=A0A9N7NN59_STRHE|nr:Dolichyl-diphosphooligosaccharide--protein glycosyltransferase subunit 2 [Striga hermonthica]
MDHIARERKKVAIGEGLAPRKYQRQGALDWGGQKNGEGLGDQYCFGTLIAGASVRFKSAINRRSIFWPKIAKMYLQFYINENGDKVYTTKKETPVGLATQSAHPARFSPDDKFSRQRILLKKRFANLRTVSSVTGNEDSQILLYSMAPNFGFLVVAFLVLAWRCESAAFGPVSELHRSAALEIFNAADGSFGSLEDTYEALKTFEILGIEKKSDVKTSACASVASTLLSASSAVKDLFHALSVNGLLKCELKNEAFRGVESRLQDSLNVANSLLDYYYSVGGLVLLKDQTSEVDVHLNDADKIFRSIKSLSQSDGRWRISSNNPESSSDAAGIALETLAGVISLASSEIDHSLIATLKSDIGKLFDGIERYDDGTCYFDEKLVDARSHLGPLSASASVIRGITAFAEVTNESLNLPWEKILGLAKFFLGVGIPGSARDFYYQIHALACLENIRGSIPLILSLPATVLSVTKKDQLKVRVSTVLGSPAPPLSVKLMQIFVSGSKDASIIDQKLKFDPENAVHVLETLPTNVDVGKYVFSFEIVFEDPEHKKNYATGGRTKVLVHVTGAIKIENAEIEILDSDLESVETKKKLDLSGENSLALSANHLQKLKLSYSLTSPFGNVFRPHQAFLKLRHESGVEHIFLVENSGKKSEIILDFLGLVEKFFYLSGRYDIQLTVGDSVMENSFLQALGHVQLDLPEAPEKAPKPPAQPVDPYSRYGPKAEIAHIFRAPEKRPPTELSLAFLGFVLLPFFGFLAGLVYLRANLKNLPKSTVPATFALLFHLGIAAVLTLYALFWIKLDLFTTLKALGVLGIFLMFFGHKTLSHLASTLIVVLLELGLVESVLWAIGLDSSSEACGRLGWTALGGDSHRVASPPSKPPAKDEAADRQSSGTSLEEIPTIVPPGVLLFKFWSFRRDKVLRIFKLNTGQDDHAIMFFDDYIKHIDLVTRRMEEKNKNDGTVFEWFKTHVIQLKLDTSISHQELCRLLSLGGTVEEEHISKLISAGLIIRQLIDPDMYWFSIPNIGSVLKGLSQGRKELLSILNRRKYKEMILASLEKKRLRLSPLDMRFHLRDLIGSGRLKTIQSPSGLIVRIAKD